MWERHHLFGKGILLDLFYRTRQHPYSFGIMELLSDFLQNYLPELPKKLGLIKFAYDSNSWLILPWILLGEA